MRAGIRLKLFLTLLIALCAVVLVLVMLMQWSFDRGFQRYVATLEEERLEQLGTDLAENYVATGSWEFLRADPQLWWRLLIKSHPSREGDARRIAKMERLLTQGDGKPDLPPHTFEARSFLLDAARHPLAGKIPEPLPVLHPVTAGQNTVGYLGLTPHRYSGDSRQLRFVKEQERAFLVIGLMLACVVALLAIPLAHSLARRTVRLAEGTHRLASGHFDSRIIDRSGDELGQLAHDFNRLAIALKQNETTRRQWVADISHELRTPVAILRGEIEALRDGVRPATAEAHASLHTETLRLQRLIDDLHQLALADIVALTCHMEDLDIGALLQEITDDYSSAFIERQLKLSLVLPATPLVIQGDAERLRQLVGNLLENSFKYTDPGGQIELSLYGKSTKVIITLADSAPGVPTEALPHLFDRLYRVESSRNRGSGGAGLGLAICRAIVVAHQGEIAALPSTLGGVCIEVILPLGNK